MDLSAIMTMDFEDNGLGENEFQKMKEKKSSVDLSKFVLDDELSDAARNNILMKNGTHIQLICAFSSLARISINEITADGKRTTAQMQEVLSENWGADIQDLFDNSVACVTDTATDADIIRRAVGSATTVVQYMASHPASLGETDGDAVGRVATQFMRLVLAVLNRTSEADNSSPARRMSSPRSPPKSSDLHKPTSSKRSSGELACEALPQLMCFVPAESTLTLAVPMCQMMADVSRSDNNRCVASEILGSIVHARTLSEAQLEDLLLPLVQQLCQDVSSDVRESMSLQLNNIIRSLSTPRLVDQVLPDMLELLDDEKQQVRYAVIITAIDMISILPKDFFARKVLPKLLGVVNELIEGDESFPTFPPELPLKFGLMFHSIFANSAYWEDEASRKIDMDIFLKCYEKLSSSASEKTRKKCCFNYPAMLQTVGKEGFEDHILRSILFKFVQDPSVEVRRLVALFLHELCSILSPEQCSVHVFDVLKQLLKDEDAHVWSALFGQLHVILNIFARTGNNTPPSTTAGGEAAVRTEAQQLLYQELLPLITTCIKTDRRVWRSQVTLVSQLERFPLHFNHAALVRSVIPPLMKLLECSNIPLQKAACRVLCSIGRQCTETRSHEDIIRRFNNRFSCSESCTLRKTFLLACEEIMQTHSRRFGREIVVPIVTSMLDDLVADVQRRALQLVPAIWKVLRPNADKDMMKALLERLDLSAKSPRKYFSATAQELLAELDSLRVKGDAPGKPLKPEREYKCDEVLEKEEIDLGYFRKLAVATVEQATDKLKEGNKELRRKQKANTNYESSSDEDTFVTVRKSGSSTRKSGTGGLNTNSISTVGRVGRKTDEILQLSLPGGGSSGDGGGSRKSSPTKPTALPRHPDILPNLKNNNVSSSNSTALMSGKIKPGGKAKRRPPGVAKLGKSPRSGKNLRSKPKGIKKKKTSAK